MNNFPVWWDTTITIYNKYEDPQTRVITWYRTVLDNCFWKATGNVVTINDIRLDTDNVVCRIPKNDLYRKNYEWQKIPNDERSNFFTLSVGDIIIPDEVDDEIDEYTKNKHSTDIIKKYKALQGCITVNAMAHNIGEGRCNEHYYVGGR